MTSLSVRKVSVTPFADQKPGTSGLRKKTRVFMQKHYLECFVQATFDALDDLGLSPRTLVVGGDGRYLCAESCQVIIRIAAANGVETVLVGQNGLLSTPAVSAIVRTAVSSAGSKPDGAFILTASHNPGGADEDFGIKYNLANGGPAPEVVTGNIFEKTKNMHYYRICDDLPSVNLTRVLKAALNVTDGGKFTVDVVDPVAAYGEVLSDVFDFNAIRILLSRPGFCTVFDGMHGVAGPYLKYIFGDQLGVPSTSLLNCDPKVDFGGGHPDPNLTYAPALVAKMGLKRDGTRHSDAPDRLPDFGAAADGDADRNMVLGGGFFVTPSDSVAVLAANSDCIPFFSRTGLKAVARSMPTSAALDRVAKAAGIQCFEVPTGWKFFGNLMDSKVTFQKEDYNPLICGEESFGTGSNHVREKDGLWAMLAWLSVIAAKNAHIPVTEPATVGVQQIVEGHWRTYGRNYYCRYDYEGVESAAAEKLMDQMRGLKPSDVSDLGSSACQTVDDFRYVDPVDGCVSERQGIRTVFADGSRFVFRLSGTGSAGATIRLYIEQYVPPEQVAEMMMDGMPPTATILGPLVKLALTTSRLSQFTGRSEPTVIT